MENYSLLEAFYGNSKYSLLEVLKKTQSASITSQAQVGSWALEKLNKTSPGRYWGYYVLRGGMPDVRIYDSQTTDPNDPDLHKCVAQIEVKDATDNPLYLWTVAGGEDPKAAHIAKLTGIGGWLEAKKGMYGEQWKDPKTGASSNLWFTSMIPGTVTSELSKSKKNDQASSSVQKDIPLANAINDMIGDAISFVNSQGKKGYVWIHGHNDSTFNPTTNTYTKNFVWHDGRMDVANAKSGFWSGTMKAHTIRRRQSEHGAKSIGKNPDGSLKVSQGHGYPLSAIIVRKTSDKSPAKAQWCDYPGDQQRQDYLDDNALFGKNTAHFKGGIGSTKILKRKSHGSYTPGANEKFEDMMHKHLQNAGETHYAVVKDGKMHIAAVGVTSADILGVGKANFDDSRMDDGSGVRSLVNDRNVSRENFAFDISGGTSVVLPSVDPLMYGYVGPTGKEDSGIPGSSHEGFGKKP